MREGVSHSFPLFLFNEKENYMKKVVNLLFILLLISSTALASTGGSISATDVEAKTDIKGRHVLFVNDGPDEVFIKTQQSGEGTQTATVSEFELPSGDNFTLDSDQSFTQVSTICNSAETATIRYISWE